MKPSCLILVCILLLVSQISCQRRGYGGRRTHQDIDREESLVSFLKKHGICQHVALDCFGFFQPLSIKLTTYLGENQNNNKTKCN